ncbi:MAG TPA: hypothetical protein VL634_05595 [Mycobacterium sp.]|nr:hypothetical protein [Mycobacterium sp.]
MTRCVRGTVRVIAHRLLIAVISSALLAVAGQYALLPPNQLTHNVIETASIVQSPTSIGSADSDLYNRSQADVDRTLDTLQAMGVQNVRIVIPWAGVQPLNLPFYNWANVDRMVNAAAERNMGVLAVLNSTPVWASDRYLSGHPDPNDFAKFAGLVADRYQGEIAAYEVWNEPNALTFWNPVDPVAYTHLLQAGYTAIKAEDPDALVVGGVVASLFSAGDVTINPQDFVAQMYAAGARGSFDAISFHPYHFTLEFSESGTHPAGALNQLEQIRQVMVDNGDGALKVWATEYGLPTSQISTGDVITEEQQAAFIEDFLRTWQTVDGTGPVFIYSTRDTLSGDPDIQKNFGFFYTDWTPKQAALIIAQFAGGQLPPESPNRPILDAAIAFARAIVDATVRVIQGGIKLFAAAVNVTVQVIKGLIDLGVRVVKGVANAIGGVIDSITDRVGPDNASPAAKTALRVPAAPQPNWDPPKVNVGAESRAASGSDSAGAITETKPIATQEVSDSDNKPADGAGASDPESASTDAKATSGKSTEKTDATATSKKDPETSAPANDTTTAKDDDAAAPGDQVTKNPKKKP